MISSGVWVWIHFSVVDDRVGHRLRRLFDSSRSSRPGVERAARIFAAEHVERVLLRARVAQDLQILVLALQHRDRRVEHDRGIDLALLHRRDRRGVKPDADDADRIRVDAVLAQQVFQEEIGRRARRADADLFAGEILDRVDLAGSSGDTRGQNRDSGHRRRTPALLALGGEIDAVIEIAGDDVGAAAEHRLQRLRAALEIDQFDSERRPFCIRRAAGPARSAGSTGSLRRRPRWRLSGRLAIAVARRERNQRQCSSSQEARMHFLLEFVHAAWSSRSHSGKARSPAI